VLDDPRPRLGPARLASLGPVNWLVCRAAAWSTGVERVHLFDALARRPSLFRAWLLFAAHLMPGGSLGRAETELLILRVGHLRQCAYEIAHHERLARRAGVDAAALARVEHGAAAPGWSDREAALLALVEELVTTRGASDEAWARAAGHLSEGELVEVCLLVGHYEMLATTIAALRLSPDTRRGEPAREVVRARG